MWIAQQQKRRNGGGGSRVGQVTLGGDPAAVCLDGERRELPIFGPGGYIWRPARGDQVLVLKTGADGEAPCVAGARCGGAETLREGEVLIHCGSASIHLTAGGQILLTGDVYINGKPVLTGA